MASTFIPFPYGPLSRSDRRLAFGLVLSLLVHLLLVAGVRPMTAAYPPVTPLQVEIRHLATEPDAPLSGPAPSDLAVDAAPLAPPAEAAKPEPAPIPPGAVARNPDDLGLPLDKYYTSRDVEVRAEPLNEVDLLYPLRAYQMRTRGKVTLRLLINERGGLDQVTVLEAEPRGVFEEAALTATNALQFLPALRHGRRVKSQKTVEVVFDPYERINVP